MIGSGSSSRCVEGTAEPRITGSELVAAATIRGPGGGVSPDTLSWRGVPLRAESAANGETKFGRVGGVGSGRRVSAFGETFCVLPTIEGLAVGRCILVV